MLHDQPSQAPLRHLKYPRPGAHPQSSTISPDPPAIACARDRLTATAPHAARHPAHTPATSLRCARQYRMSRWLPNSGSDGNSAGRCAPEAAAAAATAADCAG
eukprot:452721-Prymnesium_polylepis.1